MLVLTQTGVCAVGFCRQQIEDDDFYFHVLAGEVSAITGLIADATPPFGLYLANFNQIQRSLL